MIDLLKYWDSQLFLWLNDQHNAFFDFVMFWASNKFIWIPLYLFFLYLVIRKYKRNTVWILVLIGVLILCADQFSVGFKNYFERLRPCHEPALNGLVHLVQNKCGGQFGFVSSHATNHFAIAVFLSFLFKNTFRYFPLIIISWAAIIAYSRIYLGVHYPGDVLGGALLGTLIGFTIWKIYLLINNKFINKPNI